MNSIISEVSEEPLGSVVEVVVAPKEGVVLIKACNLLYYLKSA